MELKTGYKQTEVGVIPSDWKFNTLGGIFQFKQGVQCSVEKQHFQDGKGLKRFVRIIDLTQPSESPRYILDPSPAHHINVNDLFMVRYGSPGLLGFGYEGVIANNLFRLIPKTKMSNVYFYHLLSYKNQDILQLSSSTTMAALNFTALRELKITYPSTIIEQTSIATALSDTDQYITHLEKLIAKKRNIKQGAMQELLRAKEGWVVNTYGEVFDFLTTATYSRADLSDTGEIGYVHYGDIHTKWSSFLDFKKYKLPTIGKNQLKNYPLLREGDIIMADASEDYSGVGESIEVKNLGENKSISGLHTFLLRDKKGVFVNGFKGYIHKSKIVKSQIEKLASGLKVYGISKYNLKAVQIPIPPIEEQTRIATILSDMDSEITTLETKLAKAQSIKQGMMQQLLTGKIRLI